MTFFSCYLCTYFTDRKYNLQKHIGRKHKTELQNNEYSKNVENVTPKIENVTPNNLQCSKCNKIYKTTRYLYNHEKVCNKVDSLTCPRCMISFSNRHHKSRHVKADKCKARSIIHARTPNIQNITNNTTNNIQNAETINNNNIIINNFGSERIDHISHGEIQRFLLSGANTVTLYIEKKHFDKDFPENNNIKYTHDNRCLIMEENSWKEKDIGLLSNNLVKENTEVLLMYCDDNEIKLLNDIKDTEKYEHIRNKLFIIYNKTDNQKYNDVLTKIKELIKNSFN